MVFSSLARHPPQGILDLGIEVISIDPRANDGYISAAAKEFMHYNENKQTKDFLQELSSEVGIPTTELVYSIIVSFRTFRQYRNPDIEFSPDN